MLPHMRQLVAGTISPEQGYFRFKVMGMCKGIFFRCEFFCSRDFLEKKILACMFFEVA